MEIGIVIGNIVSTVKHPVYKGCKLLVVESVDPELRSSGTTSIAVDAVHAGIGDVVLVAREGKTAADVLGKKQVPVRSVIVGIIDHIEIRNSE